MGIQLSPVGRGEDVRGGRGVRVGQLMAGLHTKRDKVTGGHRVARLKGVRHALPHFGNKLFENASRQLIRVTWSRLVALAQGGIGLSFFRFLYVEHNIQKLWNFTPPPRPRLSPPNPKPPCNRKK